MSRLKKHWKPWYGGGFWYKGKQFHSLFVTPHPRDMWRWHPDTILGKIDHWINWSKYAEPVRKFLHAIHVFRRRLQ